MRYRFRLTRLVLLCAALPISLAICFPRPATAQNDSFFENTPTGDFFGNQNARKEKQQPNYDKYYSESESPTSAPGSSASVGNTRQPSSIPLGHSSGQRNSPSHTSRGRSQAARWNTEKYVNQTSQIAEQAQDERLKEELQQRQKRIRAGIDRFNQPQAESTGRSLGSAVALQPKSIANEPKVLLSVVVDARDEHRALAALGHLRYLQERGLTPGLGLGFVYLLNTDHLIRESYELTKHELRQEAESKGQDENPFAKALQAFAAKEQNMNELSKTLSMVSHPVVAYMGKIGFKQRGSEQVSKIKDYTSASHTPIWIVTQNGVNYVHQGDIDPQGLLGPDGSYINSKENRPDTKGPSRSSRYSSKLDFSLPAVIADPLGGYPITQPRRSSRAVVYKSVKTMTPKTYLRMRRPIGLQE